MRVERCADVGTFSARAGTFLADREAEHNLILGLCARLERDPNAYGDDPYLALVEDGERIVGAALRTPPYGLLLSEIDDLRAVEPLAADVHEAFGSLPGVLGPKAASARFVDAWRALTGAAPRLSRAERIYEADSVTAPPDVPGRVRPYEPDDRGLAERWFQAFSDEAHAETPRERPADVLDRRLGEPEGGIVLWEDGGDAVSLAGFGGPTPNGIRIGPVYTPPELRRRGYASALTAALTQSLLDSGRRFCFLFTDLANPTSNSIYQRIGYRPVTDVDEWAFD